MGMPNMTTNVFPACHRNRQKDLAMSIQQNIAPEISGHAQVKWNKYPSPGYTKYRPTSARDVTQINTGRAWQLAAFSTEMEGILRILPNSMEQSKQLLND